MGVRGATLWVIIAGLLGAVVLLMYSGDNSGEKGSMLLGLDSASVIGLRVETPNKAEALTRGSDGVWALERTGTTDGSAWVQRWPADESRVRGGIRVLASAEFDQRKTGSSDEAQTPIGSLTILHRGGIETEILFEGRGVGGRVPVRIRIGTSVRTGWADRTLLETYLESGLKEWRDRGFGVSVSQAESFTIEALGERVGLRRIGGRWVLQSPVSIEADPAVVGAVLAKLSELQIDRFLDGVDPTDKAYGLENPVGFIELTWSGMDSREERVTRRLELGARADASGSVLHALSTWQYGDDIFGPRVVTLKVPDFPISPAVYFRREASSLNRADIRGLTVRRRGEAENTASLTRTIDGWVLDDGPDREGIGALISEFLCQQPSSGVQLIHTDELDKMTGYLGEIGLVVGGGVEAEVFSVVLPTPDAPMLLLIGGDLGEGFHGAWSFGGAEADRLVAWFADQFGV